jgi:hypothetical protein
LGAFTGIVLYVTVVYTPVLSEGVFGGSGLSSGSFLSLFMASLIAAMVISNQTIARTGRYKPIALGGSCLMVIASVGMAVAAKAGDLWTMVSMVFLGAGVGAIVQLPLLLIHNGVRREVLGAATASGLFLRELATLVGNAVAGLVVLGTLDAYQGEPRVGQAVAGLVDAAPAAIELGIMRVFALVATTSALLAFATSVFLVERPLHNEIGANALSGTVET